MHEIFNKFFFVSAAAGVVVVVTAIQKRKKKTEIRKKFASRTDAADNDFSAQFPPEQRVVAVKVQESLERHLGLKLPNLLPSDRFKYDLKFNSHNRRELLRIIYGLEDEFDVDLPHVQKIRKMTVGQLIALIAAKAAQN